MRFQTWDPAQVARKSSSFVLSIVELTEETSENLPEEFGTDRFLVGFSTIDRRMQDRQGWIVRTQMRDQGILIAAFCIDCLLPQFRERFLIQLEQRAAEQRVGGAIRRQDQTRRLEVFANDQCDAVLRCFEKKVRMNVCRKAGDDD